MADTNNDDVIDNGVDLNIDQNATQGEQDELLKEMGVTGSQDDKGGEDVDLDDLEERAGRVDEELEDAHTEAEREAIRAGRRNKTAERRARARERTEQLQREVQSERQQRQALESRLARLEGNERGAQLGQLEQTEERLEQAIASLRGTIADAVSKQDGQTVALATQRMQEAIEARKTIASQKESFKQNIQQSNRAPNVDPVLARNSLTWAQSNTWYRGPASNDPDSKVLTALDNAVAAAGFDPRTKEYWDELNAQVQKYLPHRVQQRDNPRTVNTNTGSATRQSSRSPVAGSGNNGNGGEAAPRNTFRLSGERVKAMKESGAWDDPKRKADMIKRYREMDSREASRR